jgi:3-hydroxyacyl-[acyl-carrier-protein] dehydratase
MTELVIVITAPLTHPSYEGHFPGRPVVAGVLLLQWVAEAVGLGEPSAIPHVKFLRALKPGDQFHVRWSVNGARVSFRCLSADQPIAEGILEFGATR